MIDGPVLVTVVLSLWASLLLVGAGILRRGRHRAALVAANASAGAALPAIIGVGALLLLGSAVLGGAAVRPGRRATRGQPSGSSSPSGT
ncbi:hypothetical protein [Patulibacter sp. SYSU D01012]|uniref:hypothetical protein n=1 Tax=Patulibacter sp. SYSU D01012 TaxID=2817381 RepID=UPI001B3096FA|nr:hypothetical protein [Patulibacter sp. SYSU D01012]